MYIKLEKDYLDDGILIFKSGEVLELKNTNGMMVASNKKGSGAVIDKPIFYIESTKEAFDNDIMTILTEKGEELLKKYKANKKEDN